MIQRIQTVYLALTGLLAVALFFVPFYSNELLSVSNGTHDYQFINGTSNLFLLAMNSVSLILTTAIILLYKNRRLQIRLCGLSMLFFCLFIAVVFYFSEVSDTHLVTNVQYDMGMYFPLIQLVLTFLAMRSIRKDEALVRSADRLR